MTKCTVCGQFPLGTDEEHKLTCKGPPPPRAAAKKCPVCNGVLMFAHKCPGAPVLPKQMTGDSPLVALYKKNSGGVWPMDRWVPEGMELVKSLIGTTDKSYNRLVMTEDMVKRLVTALCYVEKEGLLASTLANNWKIRSFMALGDAFQMQVVNQLWNECTMVKRPDKKPADMIETVDEVAAVNTQLPSSIRPNPGAGLPYVRGPVLRPFTTMGIGYRVDGAKAGKPSVDSIVRVAKDGMTCQAMNAWFMLNIRHMLVTGTAIELDTAAPRIYARAQDLFNETSVCVSRSLFGATAFPERTTDDEVALWAVDTTGLVGFDTEKHQSDAKAKPWRPGEKCFQKIPPANVIGYVLIRRNGGDDGGLGGWNFTIPLGATWTYLNTPSQPKKDHIEAELAAWATGVEFKVSGDYDFVS